MGDKTPLIVQIKSSKDLGLTFMVFLVLAAIFSLLHVCVCEFFAQHRPTYT